MPQHPMTRPPLDLEAIRHRVEAATPGPWSAADEHGLLPGAVPAWCVSQMRPGYEDMSETEGYVGDVAYVDNPREEADATFIAHAREDVPALLAEVERLRSGIETVLGLTSSPGPRAESILRDLLGGER